MAKRPKMNQQEFQAKWEKLHTSDQRFTHVLSVLTDVMETNGMSYYLLPAGVERTLQKADRNRLFSILVECLARLLGAPVLTRIKDSHRRRPRRRTGVGCLSNSPLTIISIRTILPRTARLRRRGSLIMQKPQTHDRSVTPLCAVQSNVR